jgi:hypothetical protein
MLCDPENRITPVFVEAVLREIKEHLDYIRKGEE